MRKRDIFRKNCATAVLVCLMVGLFIEHLVIDATNVRKMPSPSSSLTSNSTIHLLRNASSDARLQRNGSTTAEQAQLEAIQNTLRKPKSTRTFDDVLLMGQFNYNTDATLVQHWVRRWSQIFANIHVRGPFSQDNLDALKQGNVQAFYGEDDKGFYSPMKNFGDSLKAAAHLEGIRGVMYVHDDLMVNITNLVEQGFPWESTVMSQLMVQDYTVPIIAVPAKGGNVVYRARKTTKGSDSYLTRRSPINETSARQFSSWRWWKLILPASYEVAKDKKAEPYLSQYGAFDFFGNAVGDFGYVPTKFASEFSLLADLFTKHEVFLEIGMPTLMAMMVKKFNATYKFAEYCTDSKADRSFPLVWAPRCILAARNDTPCRRRNYFPKSEVPTAPFSLYHPIKISKNVTEWDIMFDAVVLQQPKEFLQRAGVIDSNGQLVGR